MTDEKLAKSSTTDGKPPAPGYENASAPQPIGASGQHGAYWVLSEEERRKGFVRPLRRSYKHIGPPGPTHPLRDLTAEEKGLVGAEVFVKFEPESSTAGRYWTQADLDAVGKGCGTTTTMGLALCETYAAQPGYYGRTFCVCCGRHLPVEEFVWSEDGAVVGS